MIISIKPSAVLSYFKIFYAEPRGKDMHKLRRGLGAIYRDI